MSRASDVLDFVGKIQHFHQTLSPRMLNKKMPNEVDRLLAQVSHGLSSPRVLSEADLVWVSPDVANLVVTAAADLPHDEAVRPPSRCGLMVARSGWYDDEVSPDLREQIGPSVTTLALSWFINKGQCQCVSWTSFLAGRVASLEFFYNDLDEHGRVHSSVRQVPGSVGGSRLDSVIRTAWLLMGQPLVETEEERPDRATRRRWERTHDRPIPTVTVAELRNSHRPSAGEGREVDWSHRWIVRGHWRKQWHPKEGQHVATYIAPHIKGPDDKPVVVKSKVNVWTK